MTHLNAQLWLDLRYSHETMFPFELRSDKLPFSLALCSSYRGQ